MNPQISSSNPVEITWDHPRDEQLNGEFTFGISTQTTPRPSELGVCMIEPDVFSQQIISAVEISSFAPEPYTLKCPPMRVEIVGSGDEYIASNHESNIHASAVNESKVSSMRLFKFSRASKGVSPDA